MTTPDECFTPSTPTELPLIPLIYPRYNRWRELDQGAQSYPPGRLPNPAGEHLTRLL